MKHQLLTCFCFFVLFSVHAQVGTVNTQKLRQSMPALGKTDTLIELERARYQQGYLQIDQELARHKPLADSLQQIAARPQATAAQKAAAIKAREVFQKTQQSANEYLQSAQQKLQEYAQVVQQPYYDKVAAAIKAVAVRRKLLVVQDAGALLYVDSAADITSEVIDELKIR